MRLIALDVGTKRIGVAYADTKVRIAVPRETIMVDGNEKAAIAHRFKLEQADLIVSGLPRNNSGEETAQSRLVQDFISSLADYFMSCGLPKPLVKFQDESLTSVAAEQYLTDAGHELNRQDRTSGKVDAEAAAIILQDFLESADFSMLEQELTKTQRG